MNGTDFQGTGFAGLIGALIAALMMAAKGGWELIRDVRQNRHQEKVDEEVRSKSLTDAAQEGLMALNERLAQDGERLRVKLEKAESRIGELETEVHTLRLEALGFRATISELTGRLAALEGR